MGSITLGAGLDAFESYLGSVGATLAIPTVNGAPITKFFGEYTRFDNLAHDSVGSFE